MTPLTIPGMPTRKRVITYIDGFNLYFGLKSKGWRRYFWLNLLALSQQLVRPENDLCGVKYFTSRISRPAAKQARQSAYIDAIGTLDKTAIFFGQYQPDPRACLNCNTVFRLESEKMTDVNIAVEMLTDAFDDAFDIALLVSGDSDLCAPVTRIHEKFPSKEVVVAFPPGRVSKELQGICRANFVIGRARFASSQFPDRIEMPNGHILSRPPKWA